MKKLILGSMVIVLALFLGKINDTEEQARLMEISYEKPAQVEGITSEIAMGNDVTVTFLEFDSITASEVYFDELENEEIISLNSKSEDTVEIKSGLSSEGFQSGNIEDGEGIEVIRRGSEIAIIEVHSQNDQEVERARELIESAL